MNCEKYADEEFRFVHPSEEYADEIYRYRQEFLEAGDHMDGCGPLRKYGDPMEYIAVCRQRSSANSDESAEGRAEQFLLVRKADNRLIGMAQYRFGADPRLRIGYSVRPAERGKGYAKAALRSLLSWLKEQGLTCTQVSCEPSNEASKQVILGCGGKLKAECDYKGIHLLVFEIWMQ